jgi:Fur family ferric uptake transcriptional regulator
MQIISRLHTHPSAEDIYEEARKTMPNISLGTIYRNLDNLSDDGVISRIAVDDGKMRFEANTKKHYHINCIKCGKVEDAPIDYNHNLDSKLKGLADYRIMGHNTEFFGICPDCIKNHKL